MTDITMKNIKTRRTVITLTAAEVGHALRTMIAEQAGLPILEGEDVEVAWLDDCDDVDGPYAQVIIDHQVPDEPKPKGKTALRTYWGIYDN